MRRVFALDPSATERTLRAVRQWEELPPDGRDQRARLGVLGHGNSLQWVLCLSSTADADGRYPAQWSAFNEATSTWTDMEACYLRKGINLGVPVANKRYLGRRQGSHPSTGLPVYVPLLFDDSVGDTTGGGIPYAGAAAQTDLFLPPLLLVPPFDEVGFTMGEIFDTDGFFSPGGSLFTIPAGMDGIYQAGGFCLWHATAASSVERAFRLKILVSTSPHHEMYDTETTFHTFGASATYGFRQHVVGQPIALVEGDTLELVVGHSGTGPESAGYAQFWLNRLDTE